MAANSMILPGALSRVISERDRAARTELYQSDVGLWYADMTGGQLWSKQQQVGNDLLISKNVAVKAGHGVGKVLASGNYLPTTDGWVLVEEAKVGDMLFDESGRTTRVTAVSPVWDQRKFRITFDDGSSIEAGENHEWNVLDLARRTGAMKRGVSDWRDFWDEAYTYTTVDLVNMGINTSGGQRRWRIPVAKPLQMPEADLPIDPYLLGFWLGDGTASTGEITIGETKRGLLGWLDARDYEYSLRDEWDRGRAVVTPKGLQTSLRAWGLYKNKHIPMAYLRASEAQRRELLAGIMDADGFLLKKSGGADVGIDMTNKRLSEDIYDLLMTLGCKVRWSEGEAAYTLNGDRTVTGTRYRMNWRPLENPFKIRGQGWDGSAAQRSRHTQRTIVSIEETGRLQNYCIEVDSPRSLYLAGKALIPTHNSHLSAVLVCYWVDLYYPNCFVASTAPSQSQISSILWREIKKMFTLIEKRYEAGLIDHKLPGKINSDTRNVEWKGDNGQLIGFGRKPPENKEDDSFQGIHDEYVLAIGDEAVGLSPELIDALGNITSNENSRRLLICNPTNPASYMGKIFREQNPAWSFHTISVFDSPNFTEERHTMPKEALERLTGPAYVEDKKKEYGENSARYKSRVLGEFAFDVGDALIQPEDIAGALDAHIEPLPSDQNVMGVDVASYGEDFSVAYNYHGGRLRYMEAWNKANVMETSEKIHRLAVDNGIQQVRIDASGFGGAVADLVVAKAYEDNATYQVIRMYGQAASPDKKQWFNVRAYWWDKFRLMARRGEIDIDQDDEKAETLQDELMSVEYKIAPGGGVQIESKEEMRRRGFKSPDFADAAIYASADLTWLDENPLANVPNGAQLNVNMDDFEDDWSTVFEW